MTRAARRFVLITLGLAVAIAGGVGLLNYLVDPYNRFGLNRLGLYISAEREAKPRLVRRYLHDALLLGNSRMAMIPVSRLKEFHFFNAAFGGGTPEEAYYFLEHYGHGIKLAILGVDLGQSAAPALHHDPFAPSSMGEVLDNLLNLKTAEYSFRTIGSHWSGERPSLREDGSFDATRWTELFDRPDPPTRDLQLDKLIKAYVSFSGPSAGAMLFYSRIAALAQQRGIACVVVLPPLQDLVARRIESSPALAEYRAWKRELEAILPVVIDLSLGPYTAAENFFQADPVHFKPEVGVRMFNAEVIPTAVRCVRGVTTGVAAGPEREAVPARGGPSTAGRTNF